MVPDYARPQLILRAYSPKSLKSVKPKIAKAPNRQQRRNEKDDPRYSHGNGVRTNPHRPFLENPVAVDDDSREIHRQGTAPLGINLSQRILLAPFPTPRPRLPEGLG